MYMFDWVVQNNLWVLELLLNFVPLGHVTLGHKVIEQYNIIIVLSYFGKKYRKFCWLLSKKWRTKNYKFQCFWKIWLINYNKKSIKKDALNFKRFVLSPQNLYLVTTPYKRGVDIDAVFHRFNSQLFILSHFLGGAKLRWGY